MAYVRVHHLAFAACGRTIDVRSMDSQRLCTYAYSLYMYIGAAAYVPS